MAELHWFPLYVSDWLTSTAITAMLPEQEGAYLRLLILAWGDGSSEPRLEHDERKLAAWSRLGSRWKKLGAAIVAEFEQRDGYLYNARLSEVWQEQQAKHASASQKAKTAVTVREERRKAKRAEADRQREQNGQHLQDHPQDHHGDHLQDDLNDRPEIKQSESEVVVEQPLTGLVLPSTAPLRALALEGATRSGAGNGRTLADGVRDAETLRLEGEYYRWLRAQLDAWALLNADAYAEIKANVYRELGAPWNAFGRPLDDAPLHVKDAMLEAVRKANDWPDSNAWVAERRSAA